MNLARRNLLLLVLCGAALLGWGSGIMPPVVIASGGLASESISVLFQLSRPRIAIQAGHGQGDPGALSCDGTVREADINEAVARLVVEILRSNGAEVDLFIGDNPDILGYQGDAFVALHADWCPDASTPSIPSGFKVSRYGGTAGTGLDGSGDVSDQLVSAIWDQYGRTTGMPQDRSPGHFPPRMLNYYALAQIDSSTAGAVIEMGWLSGDLHMLVNEQDLLAAGIVNGIVSFLSANAPPPTSRSDTVLLMDVSGSMGGTWQGGVKIESAKSAALDVINMIEQENRVSTGSGHQVAIATFTTRALLDLALTMDINTARQVVNGLGPQAGTNMGAGLEVSNQALASTPAGVRKVIILLSDGLTNEGMSGDQILAGPVREAAAAGTCIYTVGFGDPGQLDEELLRNIAAAAPCGEYNYASASDDLERTYIRLRHQSVGQVLGELQGQVAHGERVNAGQVDVPPAQGELYASLFWPEDTLGLALTDPQGRLVDSNYPGALISTYPQLEYVVVGDPLPGMWDVFVAGEDVPSGSTWFDVILSSRPAPPTPTPPPTMTPTETPIPPTPTQTPTVVVVQTPIPTPTVVVEESGGGVGMVLVVLLAIVGAVAMLVLATTRGRARAGMEGATGGGGGNLMVRSGPQAGQVFRLGATETAIGRGSGSQVKLTGREISRRHAVIKLAGGRFYVQDQGSARGTTLNGQPVQAAPISPGDLIGIGDVVLEFRMD